MAIHADYGWLKEHDGTVFIPGIKPAGDTNTPVYIDSAGLPQPCGDLNAQAGSVKSSLKFGNKSYNGSEEKEITAADLGIIGAMVFLGKSSTKITDGGSEAPTIDSKTISTSSLKSGNVVLYDGKEYVWANSKWEELGDEGSHALKSITVKGDGALSGSGTLADDITISHKKQFGDGKSYSSANATTSISGSAATGTVKIPQITVNEYGHITAATDESVTITMPDLANLEHKTQNINKTKTTSTLTHFEDNVTIDGTLDVDAIKLNKDSYSFADSNNNTIATINANGITATNFNGKVNNKTINGSVLKDVPADALFTDENVKNVKNTTTKAYLTGTTSSSDNTGTQIFDTGIYTTRIPGQLHVATLEAGTSILPDTGGGADIGTTALPWGTIYSKTFKTVDGTNTTSYVTTATATKGVAENTETGTTGTIGLGRLTLGNSSTITTDGNAQGEIRIYGSSSGYSTIKPGYNSTSSIVITLPSSTGTLLAYNSSGNTTVPNSITTKTFTTTDGTNSTSYGKLNMQTEGTTKTAGVGRLTLGNSTVSGTAGNASGQILIYGSNKGYTTIKPGYNSTSNITLTLPDKTCTLLGYNADGDSEIPRNLKVSGTLDVDTIALNKAKYDFLDTSNNVIASIDSTGITATNFNGKVNNKTINGSVLKDVPANAVFTDTTYSLSGALTDSNTTYTVTLTPSSGNATTAKVPKMTAATASAAGKAGLVPAPAAAKNTSFLRGDGTWSKSTDTFEVTGNTTIGGTLDVNAIKLNKNSYSFADASNNVMATINANGVTATNFIGKINGFTIAKSVPSDAKFTDTDIGMTSVEVVGDGNAVTTASYNSSNRKLTLTKGVDYQPAGNYKTTQTAVSDPTASGTSNTFISSISQDANGKITATKATVPVVTSNLSAYLPLAGGNMTGHIYMIGSKTNPTQLIFGPSTAEQYVAVSAKNKHLIISPSVDDDTNQIELSTIDHSYFPKSIRLGNVYLNPDSSGVGIVLAANDGSAPHREQAIILRNTTSLFNNISANEIDANKVAGAVWNDYAEYRQPKDIQEIPYGRVVIENGDDSLSLSTDRLQPGGNICSDTFGFAIGETKQATMPIAVSGRVLAYPAEDRNSYCAGDAVCTGPNGTVSKMTREEIREWPDRIIGYVSAIPNYETWGQNNVSVDGRIWIKVI